MASRAESPPAVGTDAVDVPVFFPEPDNTYFGIISMPAERQASRTGVLLLSGTFGGTTTLGRNRMWLRMARALADRGFPVLRFDYAGLGDSYGEAVCYQMDRPALPELNAGFDLLSARGVEDFIVVGTCYGSRTALAGSVGEPRVRGVHLLVPPVRTGTKGAGGAEHLAGYVGSAALARQAVSKRVVRKLFRSKRAREAARRVVALKVRSLLGRAGRTDDPDAPQVKQAADEFRRPLRRILHDGVPVRMLFGTSDFFWAEFEEAMTGRLGDDLRPFGDQLEIETVPGTVRGFLSVRVQDAVIGSVIDWVQRLAR